MSLPANTDVFYLRRKKLPHRTFKLWSEAPGSDNTKLFKQANLLGNSGTKHRFAFMHGNSDSSGCFTCDTSQFYFSFWRSNLISCERDMRQGCAGQVEIAISPQFLPIEPHFVRKGCAGRLEIAISPQFLTIEPHFVRKGCAGRLEIATLPQFLTIEPHFVRKGCAGPLEIAILPQFLTIEPHFVRKGCAGRLEIATLPQFLPIEPLTLCERVAPDDLKSQFHLSF